MTAPVISSHCGREDYHDSHVYAQLDMLYKCPGGGAEGDPVDHPVHYGGASDPYEAIKVIEAWELGFHLGNAVKYISRLGLKGGPEKRLEDLKKARWYLDREIERHS